MRKKYFGFVLSMLLMGECFMIGGCNTQERPSEQKDIFDYDSLYRTEVTSAYPEVAPGESNQASYGYTCNDRQGYNEWYYLFLQDGEHREMTFSDGAWHGGGAALCGPAMRPSAQAAAVRKFCVSGAGEVTLYGNYKCADEKSAPATVRVYHNEELIYSGELETGDTVGFYFSCRRTVNAGDALYFSVEGENADVLFNPVVDYGDHGDRTLYHLTATGKYYGDVFPWYDEENHKLYMGFLWSDDARGGVYGNALEVSDNMLTFRDVPEANNYDIWRTYKENGRLHFIYDVAKYIDNDRYSYGVRDNMLYFDEENERWLLIAGCYYQFDATVQTSDLVIYCSEDSLGFHWRKEANVVAAGYNKNLPECPSLMKIGDRWYVFVSVAYQTVHQVGALQYWVGDAGTDCMDVDWQSKSYAFLDGEDLCAARPVQVGEKVYLWGWIPNTYDTMPWAPWAGYLNLPREVIQLADGSLGTRLDPGLSKLLNYGKIYRMTEENITVETGNAEPVDGGVQTQGETALFLGDGYRRNYVTFSVDMGQSNQCGYVLRQDGREYRVLICREAGKTYLKVLSPDDDSHTCNSSLEIRDLHEGKFDVKIVCDGEFIEFFVNDEYALTAHTAMNDGEYTAGLYSDASAIFTNVTIHKLISYSDIA